jgi:hypothetical protein
VAGIGLSENPNAGSNVSSVSIDVAEIISSERSIYRSLMGNMVNHVPDVFRSILSAMGTFWQRYAVTQGDAP